MGIAEIAGIAGGIAAFVKAGDFSKQFEKAKGDDQDGVRDGLVIMKNGLFLRGIGLFVLTVIMVACSDGWGSQQLRTLALVPVVAAGVSMCFVWPSKMSAELAARGNSDEQIDKLKRAFAYYNLAMTGAFFAVAAAMTRA